MDLREQAGLTIRRHAMFAGGDVVLVGVSGGADSVALLHLLRALAPEWDLDLCVLHVDHGLRPGSGADAAFVRSLGQDLGIPVHVARVAVAPRGSPEAAARDARHAALGAWADRLGATRIALGHTADDQAETVLMRLLGGTGMRGLAGIPPVRGRIVRPLIDVRRGEILAELGRAGLRWVEDPSNADPRFPRNRVRHELLPLLAGSYNPRVVAALGRLAARAREARVTVEGLARTELARLVAAEPGAVTLDLEGLRALPVALAVEVLRQATVRAGGPHSLRAPALRALRRTLGTPPPRGAQRAGPLAVEVSGARVRLALDGRPGLPCRPVPVPGVLPLPEIDQALTVRVLDGRGYVPSRDPVRAAFDLEALPPDLAVRGRRQGDRVRVFGGTERRLKTLLIDAGVPRWSRPHVPIVEGGGEIVWVAGIRRGSVAPVGPATRHVVEMSLGPLVAVPNESWRSP